MPLLFGECMATIDRLVLPHVVDWQVTFACTVVSKGTGEKKSRISELFKVRVESSKSLGILTVW
jgi:hypothetical protein